jgi:predicted N-acetyltransferase YhbS
MQYEKRNLGCTYVAVGNADQTVPGYYALENGSIEVASLPAKQPQKLPRHAVPVVLLARLAVGRGVHGQGLGGLLLRDVLVRSLDLAKKPSIHAVIVDAIDAEAKTFYERFGFLTLADGTMRRFSRAAQSVRP